MIIMKKRRMMNFMSNVREGVLHDLVPLIDARRAAVCTFNAHVRACGCCSLAVAAEAPIAALCDDGRFLAARAA